MFSFCWEVQRYSATFHFPIFRRSGSCFEWYVLFAGTVLLIRHLGNRADRALFVCI